MLIYLIAIVTVLVILVIQKLSIYKLWKEKNVPYLSPIPFLGNFKDIATRKRTVWQFIEYMYNQFPNVRYFGMFQFFKPILVLKDLELIKQIAIKDFDYFPEHSTLVDDDFDTAWSNNLFAMKVRKWKHMRPTLSPAFTSSKMKLMFQFMQKTCDQFIQYFKNQNENEITVELKDIFTKFTNDVVATTAFGLECNTMKEQNNEFYLHGKKLTDFSGFGSIRFIIYGFSPFLQRLFNIKIISDEVRKFFSQVINDTLKLRREKGLVRKDMIYLLLEAQKGIENQNETNVDKSFAATEEFTASNKVEKLPITDEDIIAQAMVFFLAGFDTASTLMTLIGYELMRNSDIQSRLRQEIDEYFHKYDGNISYEHIMEMKYLDMVISETLRKWPPLAAFDRKCLKTYKIESKYGEPPLVIEKGQTVWIPAFPIHRDPKYYPNPEKFDPERFSDENKQNIVPHSYLPFGIGPRNCIGSRFALLENKVMWVHLLRNFEVLPTKDTPSETIWDLSNISYYPVGGFKVVLKKRNH